MDSAIVPNTKRSKKNQDQNSIQRSEQDAVVPYSTIDEKELFVENIVLCSILAGFCFEVLSGDSQSLAVLFGKRIALSKGISGDVFDKYADKFLNIADAVRRSNPVSGMF